MTQIPAASSAPLWRSPTAVIMAACLISLLGFGARTSLGLFLTPMTHANDWSRETFGLALAIQNLLWGAGAVAASVLADRFGPARVLALGAILYAAGIYGMAEATSIVALHQTAGVLTGLGIAFCARGIATDRQRPAGDCLG